MTARNTKNKGNAKNKTKNKGDRLYFCKLCGFMTDDLDELDFHYEMSHDYDDDSCCWWQ